MDEWAWICHECFDKLPREEKTISGPKWKPETCPECGKEIPVHHGHLSPVKTEN